MNLVSEIKSLQADCLDGHLIDWEPQVLADPPFPEYKELLGLGTVSISGPVQ